MVEASAKVPKLAVINGLRGVAILAVIHFHLVSERVPAGWFATEIGTWRISWGAPVVGGWLGVDLFFLLSGFVLFLPYRSGDRTMRSTADLRDYAMRRARRLLPLYYLGWLVGMAFFATPDPSTSEFWWDLLWMGTASFNFVERLYFPPYNWVLWSLGIEIWFSVVFPLLIVAERRFGIARLFAAMLVVSLLARILGDMLYAELWAGGANPLVNPLKDSLLARLDEFVAGMVVCHLFVRRQRLRPWRATMMIALGVVAVWGVCILWDGVLLGDLSRTVVPFINNLLIAGLMALTFGALSLPRGGWRRLLTNTPLQVAGMMCYSLYVWHGIIMQHWIARPADFDTVHVLTYLALTFVVAAYTYRYVEFGYRRDNWALFQGVSD